MSATIMTPRCCFIDPVTGSCGKPAEWAIYEDPAKSDGYTEACTDHVGALLTDAEVLYVYPLVDRNALKTIYKALANA